jgi:hypothetical protein
VYPPTSSAIKLHSVASPILAVESDLEGAATTMELVDIEKVWLPTSFPEYLLPWYSSLL